MQEGLGWSVDAAVSGAFASLARTRRREGLRPRGHAGRRGRLLGKGLRAGVRDAGVLTPPETGVGPGGGLSPLCAPIFRHHVLEEWCAQAVRPRLQGRGFRSRFAEALVIGCELEGAARRSMAVFPEWFARFGLRMHPTKTALLACRKPEARQGTAPGNGPVDFRGWTHYWSRSRRGFGGIKRRTARQRLCRTKKSLWRWGHTHRHAPLQDQDHRLCLKRRGHFRYDGIRGNFRLLEEVRR